MTKKLLFIFIAHNFFHTITYSQNTIVPKNQSDTNNIELDVNYLYQDALIEGVRIKIPFKEQNRNIEIIDKATIQQLPVRSVNELLSYITGIDVRQRGVNGAQADIGIDGGSFDQTLVLVNGIKMTDPQTGHNTMNIPIPLIAIERIEVLKGAAARIYGINAMMGVINIVTKTTSENAIHLQSYSGSSLHTDDSTNKTFINYGAAAAFNFTKNKFSQLLSLSHDAGNGYRYNTAYKNSKIYYHNQYQNNKLKLTTTTGYINNDFGANSFYAAPADANASENVQVFIAGIFGDIKMNNNWKIEPNIQYRYAKDDYIFIRQNPSAYHNIHETNIADVSLNSSYSSRFGVLGLGLNSRMELINSNNLGKNNRNNTGMFVEYRFKTQKPFDITIGAFGNYNNVFGFNIYPGIDFGYDILPTFRLYANIGSGQRLPTFTDLHYKGPANIGNEYLQPEWATTYELGAKYQHKHTFATIAMFYRNGKDFIDWTRTDTTQPWMPQNYYRVSTVGFNSYIRQHFQLHPNVVGNVYLGYTYLYPKLHNNDKNIISHYVINSLQHQFVTRLQMNLIQRFDLSITNRLLHRLNSNNIPTHSVQQYNLSDLRLAYRWNSFNFYLDCTNLFDIRYIENGVVPMPGRWFTFGIKWHIKSLH